MCQACRIEKLRRAFQMQVLAGSHLHFARFCLRVRHRRSNGSAVVIDLRLALFNDESFQLKEDSTSPRRARAYPLQDCVTPAHRPVEL